MLIFVSHVHKLWISVKQTVFCCYLVFCWHPKRMSSWNSLSGRCILQAVFSRFGPLVSCSHSLCLQADVVWLGSVTNLQMGVLVRRSQCAADGLILTFCVYLQRRAHLAQLSQLSLGRQLIQSWRRLTGDCILSNSSTTNSIILPVLFFVSPSLPPLPLSVPLPHCFEFTSMAKIFMVAFSTSPVRPSMR